MTFTKKSANLTPFVDNVFSIASKAKEDKKTSGEEVVTDATIGTLYGEDGKLVALDSVFDHYDAIDHRVKAAYAASYRGNETFRRSSYDWVTYGHELSLCHSVIATPGGTGAVCMAMTTFLDEGETIILPDIAWGNYNLMVRENNLRSVTYSMFDGDHLNLQSIREKINEVKEIQERIVLMVNDPCHNPTGYSMTKAEWKELIALLNETAETHPCILINDIAYIDFSYDTEHSRDYMETFNDISENVLVTIAFSSSKTVTSYGLRCGAAMILAKTPEAVRESEIYMEKRARSTWSNIPNAAMENFTWIVTENHDAFLAEKQKYIDLLRERSSLFLAEAEACGLEHYPYKEGFFVTLKVEDNKKRALVHEELMKRHIYTVMVNHGIRVALCSLPLKKIKGLAVKLKEAEDAVL